MHRKDEKFQDRLVRVYRKGNPGRGHCKSKDPEPERAWGVGPVQAGTKDACGEVAADEYGSLTTPNTGN